MRSVTKPKPTRSRGDDDARPVRRRLAVAERREQLIELGIRAFSSRSYDDVSVDDVATEAGISKGLLYHYFPTKRDFYVATIEVVAMRLLDATDVRDEKRPLARLARALDAYFEFVNEHGAAYASLIRGGVGADTEAIRIVDGTRTAIVDRLLDVLDPSLVSALARITIRGWVGFVETTSLAWVDEKTVSKDELVGLWSTTLVGFMAPLFASRD